MMSFFKSVLHTIDKIDWHFMKWFAIWMFTTGILLVTHTTYELKEALSLNDSSWTKVPSELGSSICNRYDSKIWVKMAKERSTICTSRSDGTLLLTLENYYYVLSVEGDGRVISSRITV